MKSVLERLKNKKKEIIKKSRKPEIFIKKKFSMKEQYSTLK